MCLLMQKQLVKLEVNSYTEAFCLVALAVNSDVEVIGLIACALDVNSVI